MKYLLSWGKLDTERTFPKNTPTWHTWSRLLILVLKKEMVLMETTIKWHKTTNGLPEGFEPCYFVTIEEDVYDESSRRLVLHRGDYDPTWRHFRDENGDRSAHSYVYRMEYSVKSVPYWTEDIPLPPCPPPKESEDE
jgi:hypothetical protein